MFYVLTTCVCCGKVIKNVSRAERGKKMKRVNISLEENVLSRLDDFSKRSGLNRSSLITVAVNSYIDAQEKIPTLQNELDKLKLAFDELKAIK